MSWSVRQRFHYCVVLHSSSFHFLCVIYFVLRYDGFIAFSLQTLIKPTVEPRGLNGLFRSIFGPKKLKAELVPERNLLFCIAQCKATGVVVVC